MDTKTCSKCKEAQALSQFWKSNSAKDGLQNQCMSCQRAAQTRRAQTPQYREAIKEWKTRHPSYSTEWGRRNPALVAANNEKYRASNPERWAEVKRVTQKNKVERLTDSYMRGILRGYGMTLPEELIEAKRMQLRVRRLIAQRKENA